MGDNITPSTRQDNASVSKYKNMTQKDVLLALEELPMDTFGQVEKATFHAGVLLIEHKWKGKLTSETLYLDREEKCIREVSCLCFDGNYFNTKGESKQEILDGRYPDYKGATSIDGIGEVCGYNPSHLDKDLLAQIEKRFDSVINSLQLETTTPETTQGSAPTRRRV